MRIGGSVILHISDPAVVSNPALVRPWDAVLDEFDGLPDREDSRDPLTWDAHGLPAARRSLVSPSALANGD
jgi:hypothetical protein